MGSPLVQPESLSRDNTSFLFLLLLFSPAIRMSNCMRTQPPAIVKNMSHPSSSIMSSLTYHLIISSPRRFVLFCFQDPLCRCQPLRSPLSIGVKQDGFHEGVSFTSSDWTTNSCLPTCTYVQVTATQSQSTLCSFQSIFWPIESYPHHELRAAHPWSRHNHLQAPARSTVQRIDQILRPALSSHS